jgi:hypothetical protein
METAVISAASALTGSLIGSATTFTATWLNLRAQQRAQKRMMEAAKRHELYAAFIVEASKRLTDAWSHQAEGPEIVADLYALVEQMRLISSGEVVAIAERVIRRIIGIYNSPNRSAEDWKKIEDHEHSDPLRDFSDACRNELRAI